MKLKTFILTFLMMSCSIVFGQGTYSESAKTEAQIMMHLANDEVGTITIANNISIGNTIEISNGRKVTIDLNGHELSTNEEIYIFKNFGKLTITDSDPEGKGTIIAPLGIYNGKPQTRTISTDINYNAQLTINGGKFVSTSSNVSAAIYNHLGVINIRGGEFYGEYSAITNYGMANIENTYIECLNRDNGAAAIINDFEIEYGENVRIVGRYTTATETGVITPSDYKPTYLFAELKDTKYPSLQEALDACTTGDNTINLLFHNSDNATVSQKEGVNITIDGNGYKGKQFEYSGTIYVNGNSRHTGAETLTIQDVDFYTEKDTHDFISCNDGGNSVIRYAHNVTVQDCNFTATEASTAVVALRFRQSYNINVIGSTFTNLHSAMWATGTSGIAFDNIEATKCKEGGISAGTSTPVSVKNSTIEGAKYGVRADGSGAYSLTVENSTLKAEVPVIVRNTTGEYNLTVKEDATLASTNNGPQVVVTAGKDDEAYVTPTSDVNVTLDNVTSTFGLTAKIGNAFYATLQDAVDNAKTSEIVTLIADNCKEDVTVNQAPNYAITIDGAEKTFKGTITVDGKSERYETTALTIQNVNFDATEGITYDACIRLGNGTNATRYTNNVTVENCTFTDNDYTSVAVKSYTGGDWNLVVKDCEANGMHSLAQLKNIEQGLVISGNIANTKNGINLNQTAVGTIAGNEINVKGYAVRIGESTGGNITLNENTLKTDNTEGDPVIELRGTVVALNMEKNVVSGNTHIKGTAGTISVDANYWDGKEAPVVAEGSAPIVVNSYYSDDALTNLVRNEMGSIYAFVSSDRIFGDVTTNAEESIKIEIIGKDGNPIGTSSLENLSYATGFNKQLTWRINLGDDDSDSWAMTWEEGCPSINNMPAKVKLYVDDAAVAEAEIRYTANGDGTSPVFAAKTNANGKINSFIACEGKFNLNEANTFLANALTAGDNVAITVAGTYAVPTGKDLTITGAVENVKFDMSKAVGINSSMTFNNVTFEYGNANYVGLQHAGTMVYNNCIINGQVFLYGTSETFNNCTFNQNSSDAYNVWTYGAKEVAFNECTFNSAGKSVLVYNEGACATDLTVTDTKFIATATVDDKAAIEIDCSLMPKGTSIVIDGVEEGKTTATGFGENTKSGSSLWNDKKVVDDAPNGGTSSEVIIDDVVVKEPALMNLAGGGTEENPYLISNLEDLIWFRYQVNAGVNNYAGKHVKLAADINLESENWTPIGDITYDTKNNPYKPVDNKKVFSGVFNGNDKVISNLKIERTVGGADTQANVGLFGITGEGAVIKNLTLTNVNITTDGRNVGALAGFAYKATLSNITVNGNIQIKGGNNVSGVAGMTRYFDMSATNIKVIGNDGSAIVGNNIVGGIFAEIAPNGSAQTFESLSVENVAITGASGVGGIVGLLTTGAVDNVTVKNVALTGRTDYQGDAMGRIRLGSVSGLMGGQYATIANVTTENVTAKNLEGTEIEDLPIIGANYGSASNATEAKIGDIYYATLQTAINNVKNGETITLLADCDEEVTFTQTKDVSFVLDGNKKTYTGSINITARAGLDATSTLVIKDFNFKTDKTSHDFINSVETNYYPNNITITGCSFEGTSDINTEGYAVVAVRLKSAKNIKIENCTGTGLHSFLQNVAGWNLTIDNVDVNGAAEGGFALGTVQGVTVKNCEIKSGRYGIRLDGQYNNNAVIADNTIEAFIPVVVRKASVDGAITFNGTNVFTQSNDDGYWCVIGTEEYKTNGALPSAATAKINVTLNDTGLDRNGIYGNYGVAKIGNAVYNTFADALNAVNDGETITVLDVEGSEVSTEIEFTKDIEFTITGEAPNYALPVVTFQNATVNISNAEILIPELDARQNATINVINSTVYDAGGNSIAKSYYNGALNISGNSVVYMMQVTTMGYINISDNAQLHATWQTNVYGNGLVTIKDNATFNTAALHLTAQDYSNRDNTDAERAGKPAEILVDGANLTVGKVLSSNNADYSYNSSHGINVGTKEGKSAILNIKNGGKVNIYMANGETTNFGAGATVNVDASTLNTICRAENGTVTLANNGTVNVTGAASINIKNLTGKAINFTDVTIADAYIGGRVNAFGTNNFSGETNVTGILSLGYETNPTEQVIVNVTGKFNGTNVIIRTNNNVDNILNVGSAEGERTTAHFGQLGASADVNIVNSDVTYGYAFVRNDFNVTNSTMEIKGGVNTYFAGDAKVVLDNTTWNLPGYANIGSYGTYMYGNADITLKNSSVMKGTSLGIEVSGDYEVKVTIEDNSRLEATKLTNQGSIVLANVDAKVTSNEFDNAPTTSVAYHKVNYVEGSYVVVAKDYVAQIYDVNNNTNDDRRYETLAEAATAAQDGETIQLLWNEGDAAISMAATFVGNKTVTITGTADVDWSKGWFYVGRNGEGDGHVIFDNANLTSTSVGSNSGLGLNVSCKKVKEGEYTTNDGEVEIINSNIQLDYLIGKGNIKLDNSTLNVYEGFAVGARPASETGGVQRTVTMDITNGSNVIVKNHNGQGLGYESMGIMNIDATSSFETTQAFLITADGTMNVNGGNVMVVGKLTNKGTVNVTGNASMNVTTTADSNPINFNNVTIANANIGGEIIDGQVEGGAVNAFGTNNFTGETNIEGILSVGYDGSPAEQVVVNITGNFNGGNVLIGSSNEHVLNVGNAEGTETTAHFGQLGAFGDVNIVNADVTYGYTFIRNDFNVINSTMEIKGGVNTYFAGNAKVVLDKTTWNLPGFANIGSYGDYMYGNADITLKNGSSMTATNLGIQVDGEKVVKLTLEDSSTLTATKLSNQGEIVLANVQAKVTSNELTGTNNVPTTTVADHKVVYENGAYVVTAKHYVAQVKGTDNNVRVKFETFAEALDAVENGETIELLGTEGSEISKELEFTKDIEFTITGNAPNYALPVVTFQNATVNIKDANFQIPELDARQNATINVINSTIVDAGGNSIVKSYYNGAINIDETSTVYAMQVTTMGYITVDGTLNATWQTNVYGNGLITLNEGATFNTAALHLTAQDYSGRDNTDAARLGKPAEIVVDGANLTIGKVLSAGGADYSYNSSYGINVGTIEGKSAILNIINGGTVNYFMKDGETANIGAGGTVNVNASTFNVACRAENGTVTLANAGTINVENATVEIAKLDNDNLLFISGENTFKVEDATGSSYALRAKDGVVFNNSYVKGTANETIRLLGSATFNGGFECAYLQGQKVIEDNPLNGGIGGTIAIEEGTTVHATYGVEISNDYTLNGGNIELSGGNADGDLWGFVFQNSECTINSNIKVVGNTGTYAPIHFTNVTATVNGNISQSNSGGEVIYIKNSEVTFAENSNVTTTTGVHVNDGSTLTNRGEINGNVTVKSTLLSENNITGTIVKAEAATIQLTGGIYTTEPQDGWCAESYGAVELPDGTWFVRMLAGTQTREFANAGWYWFSTYIQDMEGQDGLTTLKSELDGKGKEIKSQHGGIRYYPAYDSWTNALTSLSTSEMYMINTTDPVTVEFNGDFVEYESRTINLVEGWNWIGYPVSQELDINVALKNLQAKEGDYIKGKNDDEDAWFVEGYGWWSETGDFKFKPGHGYMYLSQQATSFTFNAVGGEDVNTDVRRSVANNYHWNADATQYPSNMTMVAVVDGIDDNEYEVAAFVNGEVRGSARPAYFEPLDTYILVLTIHGDDVEEMTFKYYDLSTNTEYDLNNKINYSNDAIVGSIYEPYMLTRGTTGIGEAAMSQVNIYPNPTTTGTEINLEATCDKVEVFNALGVKVVEYQNVDTIDALETAGIYVIRITNNGNVQNCRLVVK